MRLHQISSPHQYSAIPVFPYWYGHPEGALVIFEPVPRHPGCSSGKLYLIQNNKNIREMGLAKKTPSS
jgi:hypothetical protein